MALTDAGAIALAAAIMGDITVDVFSNGNAALGVGDDSTIFSADQTELEAEEASDGESLRKGMDGGYPSRDPDDDGSTNKIRFRATFGNSEANFDWAEWGIFNDDTDGGGVMLNRVVESFGTKTSDDSWILEIDFMVSAE